MIDTKLRLRIGAVLHFIIAAGHLACLFFLDEAFRAFNILEEMTQLSFGLAWLPYAITVALSLAFAAAGFCALSTAGEIRPLPLQRLVVIAVVVAYSLRALIGFASLFWAFSLLELFSSLAPAFIVWCYWPGMSAKK